MTVLGPVAGQLTAEQAVVATLRKWLPFYVVTAARRYAAEDTFGITSEEMEEYLAAYTFPFRPRDITVAKSFEDWPINALPHVQIISPSWKPDGGSQNGKRFRYELQVACLVGAQQKDDTRLIRACYEEAIIGVLEQNQSLGNVTAGIDPIGGGAAEYTEMSGADEETFQGSVFVCEAILENVLEPFNGPGGSSPPPLDEHGVPEAWPEDVELGEGQPEFTLEPEEVT